MAMSVGGGQELYFGVALRFFDGWKRIIMSEVHIPQSDSILELSADFELKLEELNRAVVLTH